MPERVMSCSSPYEAWSVHVGFLQKAFTDYQKELTALAKLGVVKSLREENESICPSPDGFRPTLNEIPSGC